MKLIPPLTAAGLVVASLLGIGTAAHAQVVVRDVVTGEFRAPTAAEAKQLRDLESVKRSRVPRGLLTGTPNPQPVRMPDGSDFLENTDADLNYTVVVRAPDGRLITKCVANQALAERMARGEVTSFAKNYLERLNER